MDTQFIPVPNFPGWFTYGPDGEYVYRTGVTRTRKHRYSINQVLTVRASEFLGTPKCRARVIAYTEQGYVVLEQAKASAPNFGPGDKFDVSFTRWILIGPPLHGQLVEAH